MLADEHAAVQTLMTRGRRARRKSDAPPGRSSLSPIAPQRQEADAERQAAARAPVIFSSIWSEAIAADRPMPPAPDTRPQAGAETPPIPGSTDVDPHFRQSCMREVSISVTGVSNPLVGVIMGSDSDLPVMQGAIDVLVEFGVAHEVRIVSAHRTPDVMMDYARSAADRGLGVIIAGAGGAAHLPGMTASMTSLPVIGVPVAQTTRRARLALVDRPDACGRPVATVAIGNARNAGLLAVRIVATTDDKLPR
jgi:5-(carboxyamino)imidazole ribonucleotide mutase